MTTTATAGALEAALDAVVDPCSVAAGSPLSVRDMGLVRDLALDDDGRVRLLLCVTGPGCTFVGVMADAARERLCAVDGVSGVDVVLDPDVVWDPSWQSDRARAALDARRRRAVVDLGLRPRMWAEQPAPSSPGQPAQSAQHEAAA